MNKINNGDFVVIYCKGKKIFIQVVEKQTYTTKCGTVKADDIIGNTYGTMIGKNYILKPRLEDIIMFGIKRKTQIVYPKEASIIMIKLNLKNGSKVFECGTGSGSMTMLLANAVLPDGEIYTYDREKAFQANAVDNLKRFGLLNDNIHFILKNIKDEEIEEKNFDAAFLDVKEPWLYIRKIKDILLPSAPLGILVPTTNQVSKTLYELEHCFADIEVLEVLTREYKVNPARLRPQDIMVGHTGYLIFAR